MTEKKLGRWWPLATVCIGTFMLLVDVTIVNVALPDMAVDLETSFSSLQWVIDIYALALAALVLGAGSIADLVGHRRVYITGLVVFALASLASGLAPNSGLLITARAVQGIGAAAMFATTFALLNASYQGRDRGTAYGIWGAVGGASAALGPIMGGVLTESLSWRWILFVNIPVSAIAIALCLVVLSGDRPAGGNPVDIPGMLAFTVAAAGLTFGLIRGNEDGWGSAGTIASLAVSALALIAFAFVEKRNDKAMVDLALMRNRPFVMTIIASLVLSFSAFTYFAYSSLWLQSVLGYGPIKAGFVGGVPMALASFVTSGVAGRFIHRWPPGRAIALGLLLIGVGCVIQALWLRSVEDWPALIVGMIVVGIGVGVCIPIVSSSAMSAVPVQRGGMAAGMVNTARQLGFAIGIGVLGSVFTARIAGVLAEDGLRGIGAAVAAGQTRRILNQAPTNDRTGLLDTINHATTAGVEATLWVAGIVGIICAVLCWLWIRPAADQPAEAQAVAARLSVRN